MSWLGAASGATLGYILGNVPGAVAGGYYGYKNRKTKKNLPKKMDSGYATGNRKRKLSVVFGSGSNRLKKRLFKGKPGPSRYSKPVRSYGRNRRGRPRKYKTKVKKRKSSGPYTGLFTKPYKISKSPESYALSKGSMYTIETHGAVHDPNCVYITQSVAALGVIANTTATAIVRTLLNKAGFRITNQFIEIAVTDPVAGALAAENSVGLRFVLTTKNSGSGAYVNYIYDTTDNENFDAMVLNFTALRDSLLVWFRGSVGSTVIAQEIHKVSVYRLDYSVVNHHSLAAELYTEDMNIDFNISSSLVVQNRTLGALATGEVAETDRVDAQPLKGWIYEFKNGEPRVRHLGNANAVQNNYIFNTVAESGIQLIRGAQFAGSNEPFEPKYFANIAKATRIILQPGEMKRTYINWKTSGKFTNVTKKMQVTSWDPVTTLMGGVFGKSQMIAFEEMMRTPTSNKIRISYERELKVAVVVKEHKRPALLETVLQANQLENVGP